MFAGAAREAVFCDPAVIARVKEAFVPVALKAGLIARPGEDAEGRLFRELLRTRPAPQGIAVLHPSGKVLAWALSFDEPKAVRGFLDYAVRLYREAGSGTGAIPAERWLRYPSARRPPVPDAGRPLPVIRRHLPWERCPGDPQRAPGTAVGVVLGRALGSDGKPLADTSRQENYIEEVVEIPPAVQKACAESASEADRGEEFDLPEVFSRLLVSHAYLGQLDVSPLGGRETGSELLEGDWTFSGKVSYETPGTLQVVFTGTSSAAARNMKHAGRDGRRWEHRVELRWRGFLAMDRRTGRVRELAAIAEGREKLAWRSGPEAGGEVPLVARLPAGRSIDRECAVVFGILVPKPEANEPKAGPAPRTGGR